MLINNWHTHTYRCGHARGTDEEYVVAAIEAGIKKLGFSDHTPYPGVPKDGVRMDYSEADEYIASILNLKEKYKDKIEIYVGMEVEYYEDFLDILEEFRRKLDYMILGQHGFNVEAEHSYGITDREGLLRYCELVEKGCASGLIDYMAHPDVCLWSYPRIDENVREVAQRIATAAKKYDLPVEINCGSGVLRGKRRYEDEVRYPYPNREFFKIFAENYCDVVVGLDIHDPELFKTDEYLNKALSVVEGLGCRIIDDYDLIAAAQKRKREYSFI